MNERQTDKHKLILETAALGKKQCLPASRKRPRYSNAATCRRQSWPRYRHGFS